jgi:hypothetical protein
MVSSHCRKSQLLREKNAGRSAVLIVSRCFVHREETNAPLASQEDQWACAGGGAGGLGGLLTFKVYGLNTSL